MYARAVLAALFIALIAVAVYAVNDRANMAAQLVQTEHALLKTSEAMQQQKVRYDQTDRMLADSVRDRAWIDDEATDLARQLALLQTPGHCLGTRIPDSAVIRLYDYRDRTAGDQGAGAEDLDRPASGAGYRPTYGQYIADAERFVTQCNSDRAHVRAWSDAGVD